MSNLEEFAALVHAAAAERATPRPPVRASATTEHAEGWRELVGTETVAEMLRPEPAVSTAEPAWRETVAEGGSLTGLLPAGMTGEPDFDRIVQRAQLTEGGMPGVVAVPAWRECVGAETAAAMLAVA